MANNPHPQRRDFLKTAAAGAAGVMGISALDFDRVFAQSTGNVWTNGMQINPAIDNKRVICCYDTTMLANYPASGGPKSDFASQNSYVDPAKVASNMDEMAMQLAQKTSATDAWSTIFRTGNAGGWGSTRVAIKTNAISPQGGNHPRVAVIKKICDVLIQLGVQPANIVLFDARNGTGSTDGGDACSVCYSSYCDVNDKTSTKIRAVIATRPALGTLTGLNNFAAVTLTNATGVSAPADLVNGKIDILVNVAVSKMHNGTGGHYDYGTVTLCMKNHLGTFTDAAIFSHSDQLHNLKAIFEINQHSAILGGNPVRQQLCIVDALLSNGASGPGGSPDNRTDRLVMGTFAPFVDYFTGNYILFNPTIMATSPIPQTGLTAATTLIPQFVTSFGYTAPSASPASPDPSWISYPASNPPTINPSGTGGTGGGSGGASGSGGTKASGGAGSGGTSGSGGAGSGGTKASGGAGTGGTSGSGGAASGGTSASSGGSNGSGGAASGGTKASSGAGSGGTSAAGGAASSGGTVSASGGAGATGGTTSSASASGGSATTGGATSGNGTGGSGGSASSTAKGGNSESGCDVAGVDRRATRWGAMLAFGAVVAEKLRRLVSGSDRSS